VKRNIHLLRHPLPIFLDGVGIGYALDNRERAKVSEQVDIVGRQLAVDGISRLYEWIEMRQAKICCCDEIFGFCKPIGKGANDGFLLLREKRPSFSSRELR